MTKWTTIGAVGALLLGGSTLALAQTPLITPPPSGSHPEMVAPQAAPDSWTVGEEGNNATAREPAPVFSAQIARADWAEQNLQAAIKRRIEAAGYDSPHSITPSYDGYTARAMESGQSVVVDVDGNGNVRRVANQH
ncbi:MAG TPA: hypothetical protein VHT04_19500 [Stellaceae bacterium]|jgi:hypothetical protein|nr:hypothetical protein [Stellaceae bacterium]